MPRPLGPPVPPLVALLLGCLACSTSVLWIKLSTIDPVLLTALRLALAALVLSPFAWRDWRRHREKLDWTHLRDTIVPGLVLAAHFMLWIYGARLTLASNGALIVNLTPLVTPFLLAALSGERVSRRETAATLLAGVGLAILFASDYRMSPETLFGDLVCLAAMLLVATYLVLARRFRHHPTTLLYVTPLYTFAAVIAFAVTPFTSSGTSIDWRAEAPWVLGLVLFPTVIGHSLLNRAMRQLRGQVVSIFNMSQFIFAGALAWWWLNEQPESVFYIAALLVLAAGYIAVTKASLPVATEAE